MKRFKGAAIAAAATMGIACVLGAGPSADARVDQRFEEALRIADKGGKSAPAKLRSLKEQADSQPSARLAEAILARWNEEEGTFRNPAPLALRSDGLSANEIRKLAPDLATAAVIIIAVDVSADGLPTHVSVLRGSGTPGLDRAFADHAMNTPFCPRRTAKGYEAAKATITYRIEARS